MEEQKQQILFAAFQLFSSYGIKSVTMDDIAHKLGISKKTLYKYFPNKKVLVLNITQIKVSKSEKDCNCFCKEANDPVHEIFLIMDMVRKTFQNTNPSMIYDLQKYHQEAWKIMENHENEFIFGMIVENLNKGIELGLYRKSLKVDVLAKMRIGVMKLSFTPEFNPENKYTIEEIQLALLNHFLMGITTLKGYQLAEEYKKQLTITDEN